ncbi:MAG: GTPase HflX [Gammaproteobacteria bacterium]|nr:MAG: GTPase HflX [Gammaproteobacteria bacterium]
MILRTPKGQKRDLAKANPSASSRPGIAERTLLVHRQPRRLDADEDLYELELLARSAGAEVCGTLISRRQKPDAANFIGKGKAEELREQVEAQAITLVLVNHDLAPGQERNLERTIGCRVLDRTGLILDIFAQRARSHEGKLQVELAQLEHLSTRLVRGWTHLERQKGGIGLRGPGETQLETDRRLLRERIKQLNKRLAKVRNQRRIRRKSRAKIPIPTVSMVGYTNAGKSSLFNTLTGESVYAADQLFATLDPTMRRISLPGNIHVVLADTVGFIRHLPHDLVEAFKSTLEEVQQADLLIHVVDVSNPEHVEQTERVNEVLSEIYASEVPQILVYNKIDLTADKPRRQADANGITTKVWLSALTGEGVGLLLDAISDYYQRHRSLRYLSLPATAGRLRASIYQHLDVLQESELDHGGWRMEISIDDPKLAWLQKQADFQPGYLEPETPAVLAPTGS